MGTFRFMKTWEIKLKHGEHNSGGKEDTNDKGR
jgi:hypothetical protein